MTWADRSDPRPQPKPEPARRRTMKLLISEKKLWFSLDQIATHEATIGGNPSLQEAAERMMGYLEQPSHEECRQWFREVHEGFIGPGNSSSEVNCITLRQRSEEK